MSYCSTNFEIASFYQYLFQFFSSMIVENQRQCFYLCLPFESPLAACIFCGRLHFHDQPFVTENERPRSLLSLVCDHKIAVHNSCNALLRSLVNWRTLLELFTNLEADLVCLEGHLKCQVPYIPLLDYLNGWACICQHLPDHPWYAHGCKVLVHTLALLMLKTPNSLVHLDSLVEVNQAIKA